MNNFRTYESAKVIEISPIVKGTIFCPTTISPLVASTITPKEADYTRVFEHFALIIPVPFF
jgi:hypothetical protein